MGESSIKIESCGISHIGPVRDENQDTICMKDDFNQQAAYFYAVADGMGGYSNGKLASSLAIETLCEHFCSEKGSLSRRFEQSFQAANTRVYQTAQAMGGDLMGTTLTAIYLERHNLMVAHVGDTRVYLIRGQQVHCLTRDHTMVADLMRMKLISADQLRTHFQRSILSRSIGLGPFVQPDIARFTVKEGDRLVLCTDGLWSVILDEEFAALSCQHEPLVKFIDHLISLAIERMTDDNVSAIGVQILSLADAAISEKSGIGHWFRVLKNRLSGDNYPTLPEKR
jgi:PPM family protein phosphatase